MSIKAMNASIVKYIVTITLVAKEAILYPNSGNKDKYNRLITAAWCNRMHNVTCRVM